MQTEYLMQKKRKQTTLLQRIKRQRGPGTPRRKTDWDTDIFTATERDIVQALHWYRESAKGGCEAGMLIWQNTMKGENNIKKRQNGTANMWKQESSGGTNALDGSRKRNLYIYAYNELYKRKGL